MAKIHGFGGIIKVANTDAVGQLQGWNLDVQGMTSEGYSMGEKWASNEGTVSKWSGSMECYFDPADAGQIQLQPLDRVELHFYPGGDAVGGTYRSGFVIITGTPLSATKDGWVAMSFNFVGDGALESGTV